MRERPYLLLLAVFLAGSLHAQSVNLNFTSFGSSLLSFAGSDGAFSFVPDSGSGSYDFQIGSSNISELLGLKGTISSTYTIGSIATQGSVQEAPVSGTGTFSIFDGESASLTGLISWDTVMGRSKPAR
jgi:hypothetical protein